MNALLSVLTLSISVAIALFVPTYGAPALLICAIAAFPIALMIGQVKSDISFLVRVFVGGLLVRLVVGTLIFVFELQEFFGGDANTYDAFGYFMLSPGKATRIIEQSRLTLF